MLATPPDVRVIEISAFVAAPLAGMTLAGSGCPVVRVDPPGGGLDFGRWPVTPDGHSLFWAGLNRGKQSAVVDLRRDEGRELVASMVVAGGSRGGVLLTNLGPSGPLAYTSLKLRRADVVCIEIQGFPDGRSAVDYTIAARTGVPLITGPEGHNGPVNSPLPSWDIATGLYAAFAAKEAFRRRRSTGEGARVRVALSDVALGLLSALGFVDEQRLAVEPRARDGNYLYGAFGRDFLLADGSRVMIVAITVKQWQALVRAMGMAEEISRIERSTGLDLDREGDRYRARHEIAALIEGWCALRTEPEVAELFETHRVSWSPYSAAADFADLGTAGGGSPAPATSEPRWSSPSAIGVPARFDEGPVPELGPVPQLGQHTERVLAELLGLSQHEIGRLHDEGVVESSSRRTSAATVRRQP